jgi:hypothetical protein
MADRFIAIGQMSSILFVVLRFVLAFLGLIFAKKISSEPGVVHVEVKPRLIGFEVRVDRTDARPQDDADNA